MAVPPVGDIGLLLVLSCGYSQVVAHLLSSFVELDAGQSRHISPFAPFRLSRQLMAKAFQAGRPGRPGQGRTTGCTELSFRLPREPVRPPELLKNRQAGVARGAARRGQESEGGEGLEVESGQTRARV